MAVPIPGLTPKRYRPGTAKAKRSQWVPWDDLILRVFGVDVLVDKSRRLEPTERTLFLCCHRS